MATVKKTRTVGKEGIGGAGDLRDRMRDTYKPGAGPKMQKGFGNPIKQVPAVVDTLRSRINQLKRSKVKKGAA